MSNSRTWVNALISRLEELKTVDYASQEARFRTADKAERLLATVFKASQNRTCYSEDDRIKIGSLLPLALRPISLCVTHTACHLGAEPLKSALKKRSSIQFLYDDFGSFPSTDNKTVKEQLKEGRIGELIVVLDDIIKNQTEDPVSDDSDSESDFSVSPEDGVDLTGVPQSHTWWPSRR